MQSDGGRFTFQKQSPTLIKACSRNGRKLVIFVGPGISKTAPSNVPDWLGLNRSLLNALKASALEIPSLTPTVRESITSLELERSLAFAFTKLFVESVAGQVDTHLPVTGVLDSTAFNSNHAALAALARDGIVRAIVTTNFDTMIEAAFRHANVPLKTYTTKQDYQSVSSENGSTCSLFKIHGSPICISTLREVVSQKIGGLPLYVRSRLGSLFQKHHVLVVGFSSQDLEFGGDYFALRTTRYSNLGLTWMLEGCGDSSAVEAVPIEPQQRPRLMQKLTADSDCIDDIVIEADFLHFCESVNVEFTAVIDSGNSQVTANDRIRGSVTAWLQQMGVSTLTSAVICSQFLLYNRNQLQSDAVNNSLEHFLDDPLLDDFSKANLSIFLAQHTTDIDRVEGLCNATLRLTAPLTSVPHQCKADAWNRIRATAWSKLGWVYNMKEQRDNALSALQMAKAFAAALGDSAMLGNLLFDEAGLYPELEVRLERNRQAKLFITHGRCPLMFWSRRNEANALIQLSEYDAAQAALAEARHFLTSASSPRRGEAAIRILEADIMLRRGEIDGSYQHLKDVLPELEVRPSLAAYVRLSLIHMFESVASLREELIHELDWVLEKTAENGVLSLLDDYGLPSESQLLKMKSRLQNDPAPPEEALVQSLERPRTVESELRGRLRGLALNSGHAPGSPLWDTLFPGLPFDLYDPSQWLSRYSDQEDDWRRSIVWHEYRRKIEYLPPFFDRLSVQKHEEKNAWRLLDLAKALSLASERTGDSIVRQEGLHRQSVGMGLLGDTWKQIEVLNDILREIENSTEASQLLLRAFIHRDLGTSLSRIGDRNGAEDQFRKAIRVHRDLDKLNEAARDVFDFADALIRFNDFKAALRVLDEEKYWIKGIHDLEITTQWEFFSSMMKSLDRGYYSLDNLPTELTLYASNFVEVQTLYNQQRYVESADELRLLALEASHSCHHDAATDFSLQAQQNFSRLGDRRGVVQCIQDRAEIAGAQGYWGSARGLSRWAWDLQSQLGNINGQIESGAMNALSWYCMGEFQEACDAAQSVLTLALPHAPSRLILIAWWVLINVLDRNESKEPLKAVLREFLNHFPADQNNRALTVLRAMFQEQLTRLEA